MTLGKFSLWEQITIIRYYPIDLSEFIGYKAGFLVDGANNVMKLYNCKSVENEFGYYAATNANMEMVDCSSVGNTHVKSGNGIYSIINTTKVE